MFFLSGAPCPFCTSTLRFETVDFFCDTFCLHDFIFLHHHQHILLSSSRFFLAPSVALHRTKCTVTGMMDIQICKELPPPVALLLCAVGKAISQVMDPTAQGVIRPLNLWRHLHKVVPDVLALSQEIQDKFSLIAAASSAFNRLEAVLEIEFKDYAKQSLLKFGDSNMKGALDYINSSLDLTQTAPPYMFKLTFALRACHELGETIVGINEIEKDPKILKQHLPTYVQIDGADFTFLSEVFPEKTEHFEKFKSMFASTLKEWMRQQEKLLRDHQKEFKKYRRSDF